MDHQSRIAFIIAQAAMLNAEIALAQAANQYREHQGLSQAYGDGEFGEIIGRYSCLEHSAVIEYLRD